MLEVTDHETHSHVSKNEATWLRQAVPYQPP